MKRKNLIGIFVCFALLCYSSYAFTAPVPDTGQTKCYDVAGNVITCPSPGQALYGQDANYSINPMSYTKLDGSGNALPDSATSWVMVRDNVTGLVWEVKTNKDGVKNYNNPHDADNTYKWYDSNPATNGGHPGDPGDGTNTENFIKALNDAHFGGFSDWRLPTIYELSSIGNNQIKLPGPCINTTFFQNTLSSAYWSSNTYSERKDFAWNVDFYAAYILYGYKATSGYVRAVRGSNSQSAYVDNGNGTVTDTSTGLMWQQETPDNTMTWEQALLHCEISTLAGYTDWRLPTKKELRSLVDYSRYNPAINTTFFPDTVSSFYWTSTTDTYATFRTWSVAFDDGVDGYNFKIYSDYSYGYSYVRAVRGGQHGSSPVISGSVKTGTGTAISGVTITFSNGGGTATTDSSGNYSKTVSYGWSGTATPSKSGYTFTPATRPYSGVTVNQTGQNYTGTPVNPTISGSVKTGTGAAISGITITFSNGGGTATTDSSGNYSKTVSYGWSGTATPSKSGYTFTPATRPYSGVTVNQTGQNYTGTPVNPTISGSVKTGTGAAISGITITFSNGGGTATTDSSGNYSKTVSYGWSGTATPSKSGYTFTPATRPYSGVTVNQTSQNYTGTPVTPVVITPVAVLFPSLFPGETSSKSLTVSHGLSTSVSIVSASISGSNASDFNLGDSCSGKSLASNATCIITASFTPRSCGTKAATLTVSTSQGNLTASLSGSACSSSGLSSLGGIVRDAVTKKPLSGVYVSVGTNGPYLTNDSGKYTANNLTSGTYELKVSKQSYETWIGTISLNPQQSALKDINLTSSAATSLRVISVTSKYSNGSLYYFLPGISFNVDFTAKVDWGGKTPGKVRFITSKGNYDVPTSGTTASKTLNIGTECNSCSTIQAIAIAADGSQSVAKKADFIVTDPLPVDPEFPLLTNNLAIEYLNSSFSYRNKSTLSKNLLDQTIGDYKNIPILNESATALKYVPGFDFEFSGKDGKALYKLSLLKNSNFATIKEKYYTQRTKAHGLRDLQKSLEHLINEGKVDRRLFPEAEIAKFKFSFFPVFEADYSFNSANCGRASSGWNPMTGYVGLSGQAVFEYVHQFLTPIPLPVPPVPWYFKCSFGSDFDAMMNLIDARDIKLSGIASVDPFISGSLGVGVNEVVALEGTGKGDLDIAWQFPVPAGQNAMTHCFGKITFTGRVYFWVLEYQFPTKSILEADCTGSNATIKGETQLLPPDLQTDGTVTLIPRDYLISDKHTAFQKKPTFKEKRFTSSEQTYSVFSSPIVTATFPVSSANLSSAGSNVNLIWLTDNPGRSSINRTMAVHSTFDGTNWSTPVSIADNGTADFNPTSLTLGGGSIVAAWEDVATPLADTATLEEITSQLEINAALYDPIAKNWGQAVRLTDNLTLDRTPRLAGKDKNNLLLTWISNDQNDIGGNITHPNHLKYALYNGTTWSAPLEAAVIPKQIKRYNVVYDGTTANAVLALDTDNDPSTLEDLELYRMVYSNGEWGALTRLTSDTIIDDNPLLSLDSSNNVVMTWLMGNELSGVVNFDFTKRTIIKVDNTYSSSLADFKQARTSDGRVAVIYPDISENNTCDLFGVFYDPIFKLWGHPKQLTDDAETEQWPSIAFMGTDSIISTYNRKLLINPDGTLTVGALSDLYMIKHTLSDDLAVEAGSLTADIPNAAPGTVVTLSAKVQNLGDNTAQNITVNFYQGDPAIDGTLIGTVVITNPLKPGDAVTVSLPWTIPDGTSPVSIYVVIDPGSEIDTLNRSNNVDSTTLALPDLKIQNITSEKLESGHYNLVVSVANIGGTDSGASNVKLHLGSDTGTVISTINLPSLARFASIDLAFEWYAPAQTQPPYTIVAIVDEGDTIDESNELNNSYQIILISDHVLSISPTNRNPAKEAGTTTFSVSNTGTGTMPWTAAVTSGGSWLKITSGASGSNAGTINCSFTANTSISARTAVIRVTATGATGSPMAVIVTQAGTPVLSVSPATRKVAKESGTTTFSISNTGTGTMPWTAAVTSGGSWLKITSGASGSNAGTVACAFDANPSTSVRTGTIRVTAVGGATGSPKDVTVTQQEQAQIESRFLGIWSDGVWSWSQSKKQWTKIPSTANALMIAAGKVDTDIIDDLIGVWASGLWVRNSSNGQWLRLSQSLPNWIVAGDLNNDGRDDVIGSWKNDGVYYRDSATGKWVKITTPAKQLAAGNIGGTRDDLAGVWDSGLWARYSATGGWQKFDPTIPIWITTGDMTGDKRADIVGSYASGTWYRNSATGAWVKITTPAEQLAAGDIDGDGRDDLIGVWSNGLWVRYGVNGQWQQITASKPKWITTGRITDAVQAAGSLEDPLKSTDGMDILDLSQEGPGGATADMLFLEEAGPMEDLPITE